MKGSRARFTAVLAAFTLLAIPAPAAAASTAPAPIGHWALDESSGGVVLDSSAGGHDGTLAGHRITDGFAGKAVHLDGTADRIDIPTAGAFDLDAITISLWVRADPQDPPTPGAVIAELGAHDCVGPTFGLYATPSGVELRVMRYGRTVQSMTFDASSFPNIDPWDGEWHHVAGAAAPASNILDIDSFGIGGGFGGQLELETLTSHDLAVGGGANTSCGLPSFVGDIDDIRIYDRVLDREQIGSLEPPVTPTVTVIPGGSIHARWLGDCVEVRVAPPPPGGFVRLYARDPSGDPVVGWVGIPSTSWCAYPDPEPPQGTYLVPTGFEWAGDYTLQAVFTPGLPWTSASSAWTTQDVQRRETRTVLDIDPVMPGQPIVAHGIAELGDPEVGGSIMLVETTGGTDVVLDTKPIVQPYPGYSSGEARFVLPGRPAGTYSFEARYSGTANLWRPSSASASIEVGDTLGWRGPVSINGGAEWTNDPGVSVSAPAEHAVWIELSDDAGIHWQRMGYHDPVTFLLDAHALVPPVGGLRTIDVRWVDDGGRASEIQSSSIRLDTSDPTTTTPTSSVTTAPNGSKVPVRLRWTGHDSGSSVGTFQVQSSTDGKSYTTLASTVGASTVGFLSPNHKYRIRVRAIDRAGNVGAWSYGASFRVTLTEESSSKVRFAGSWHSTTSTSAWGGHTRYSTAAGASASFRFSGRGIQVVAPVGPTRGSARVYVDGVYRGTINLYSASAGSRRVVFARSWSTSGSHVITLRVVGTAGHPRFDLDAFVVLTPA